MVRVLAPERSYRWLLYVSLEVGDSKANAGVRKISEKVDLPLGVDH